MPRPTPLRAWADLAGWLLALAVVVAFGVGWRSHIAGAVDVVMAGTGSGLSKVAFALVGGLALLALLVFAALVTRALVLRALRRGG